MLWRGPCVLVVAPVLGGVLGGGDGEGEAEGLELADVVADLALGADAVVVVGGAEVAVRATARQLAGAV